MFTYFLNIAQLLVKGLMPGRSILFFVVTDHRRPSCLMCGTESSAAELLSIFFLLVLMFVVSQWMPPNYFPPSPHYALIAGHKGADSVRRCIGQTRFYSK